MINVNSTKNRIFLLIGFMASGKSFIGRKAADEINCDFFDLDEQIEVHESCSVSEIFKEKGEKYFRNIETDCFSDLLTNCKNTTIIGAGGGFPLKKENQKLMNEVSVVFINADFEIILSRLNNSGKASRPLLKNKNDAEIKKLYEKRLSVYKSTADYIVETENELITIIHKLVKAA
jgi:shikimate kinase